MSQISDESRTFNVIPVLQHDNPEAQSFTFQISHSGFENSTALRFSLTVELPGVVEQAYFCKSSPYFALDEL